MKISVLLIFNIMNNRPLPIYGKGMNSREWIYVKDHCEALLKVFLKGKIGEFYNIGSTTNLSNIKIAKNILEIGTSLGLTTAYLSNANKNSSVTTLEGDPSIYLMAKKNFQKLGLKNVTLHHGDFDNLLPKIFTQKFDFIFFDGNHSKKATLKYFNWALENFMEEAIYVFDDIYWSKGMKEAWIEISNHPKVMMSLDIFSLGIVFFKKNREKEHINLIHSCNFY